MASRASRELGLQRIGTTTRILAAGSLVAGLVLSAAAAKALPGKSRSHGPPATASNLTAAPTTLPQVSPQGDDRNGTSGSSGNVSPLTAPAQAPQPVTAPPVVSSGGS